MSTKVDEQKLTETPTQLSMHPRKFAMWLFMVSVVMIFASLTSAYIVRQAEGNWYIFDLPLIFYFSTAVIVASSGSFVWATQAAKRDNFSQLRLAISITALLGVSFLVMQIYGWVYLVDISVYFVGNPSGSFLYILTGLHGLHLVSGVVFILIVLFNSFKLKVHSKRLVQLEMCATYWHFLDILWVYLFFFLLLNR